MPHAHHLALALILALAACSNPGPAQVPVSGVSGMKGGADDVTVNKGGAQGHFVN